MHSVVLEAFVLKHSSAEQITGFDKLEGGNLNHVWRVHSPTKSFILKQSPPNIASSPEVPLDTRRMHIESKMLRVLYTGKLQHLSSARIRPPMLLGADTNRNLILMEDIKDAISLDAVSVDNEQAQELGTALGRFISELHHSGDKISADEIHNPDIQEVRRQVQYNPMESWLKAVGVEEAAEFGAQARALGQKWAGPGRCPIMGDLWPRSVLITPEQHIRLIDWEFAHWGHPAQDVAHFAAHCYLLSRSGLAIKEGIHSLWKAFADAYKPGKEKYHASSWNPEAYRDASVHFACELLIRTIGSFKEGYIFEGKDEQDPSMQQVIQRALQAFRKQDFHRILDEGLLE